MRARVGACGRWWRRGAVLLLLFGALLSRAPEALAHASLLRAEPADGEVLQAAPKALRLLFNEPVSPLVFRLIGPDGAAVTLKPSAQNEAVTVEAPAALRRGTHVLSWRVISADGHPVGGALLFSIGAATGPPKVAAPVSDAAVEAAIWAARLAIYLGLFVGVGGAAFVALIARERPLPGRAERCLAGAMVLGIVATVLSVGLQGLDALALPLTRLASPDVWASGFATSYGVTALLAALAMIGGVVSLRVRHRWLGMLMAVGALVVVGLALSSSGHASTTAPEEINRPAVFLHAICVVFWVGSLLPLLAIVRARGSEGGELARFSRVIPLPLGALLASGLYLAWVELDRPDALWTTSYGEILFGKLVFVTALLGLAAANRFALVPRLRKPPQARWPLAASIGAESALVLVILLLIAGWRFTPPPRALIAGEPASIHFHGGKAMAQIDVEPVRARGAEVSIVVLDGEFRPLTAKEVTLFLANAAAGIEPVRRAATLAEGTTWRIDDLRVPLAGRWSLRVDILIDDFDKETLEDDVLLPRSP